MNFEGRPRQRKSSRTLVITFLIGIGIGFSLCFAFLGTSFTGGLSETGKTEDGADQAAVEAKNQLPDRQGIWPGRHLLVGISGHTLEESEKLMLRKIMPGGVLLRDRNLADIAQAAELIDEIKTAMGLGDGLADLPLIVLAQEKGPAFELLGMPNAPTNAALGQMNDPSVAQKLGYLYGQALRNIGIGAVLGPVLDIYRPGITDPAREAELFSSDKNTVAWIGVTFAEGLNDAGVAPILKTYPGMGSAVLRDDGTSVIKTADIRDLVDLIQPFKRAVELNLPGVLVGHASVPVIDIEQPDLPASLSPKMVQEALRNQFQYHGVVVAADITHAPLDKTLSPGEIVVRALLAGCDGVILEDIDLAGLEALCAAVFKAVDDKQLSNEQLEQSKARLDQWRSFLQRAPVPQESDPAPSIAAAAIDALGKAASETYQPSGTEHTVQAGETLTAIAKLYGVSVEQLATWNGLEGQDLRAGQVLTVRVDAVPDPVEVAAGAPEEGSTPEDTATEEGGDAGEEPATAEAPPAEAPVDTPPANDSEATQHVVEKGETLSFIAAAYSVTQEDLMAWNNLTDSGLKEGQVLVVHPGAAADSTAPPATQTYTVVAGDGLKKIAEKFHTTPQTIMDLNHLGDPNKLIVGQQLAVPAESPAPQ